MKKLLCVLMFGVVFGQSVHLEIQNVNLDEGTLDIYMTNEVPVTGFQFFLSGMIIDSIDDGIAENYLDFLDVNNNADCDPNDFDPDLGCNLIIGVDIDLEPIPAGSNQLLFSVSFTEIIENEICFDAQDSVGEVASWWSGPCFAYEGGDVCMDMEFGECVYTDDCEEVFHEGYELGAQSGDANLDGQLNVLDIVLYANMILTP